jgi:hypothetical protein
MIVRVVDEQSADRWRARCRRVMRTRFGGSSWTDCAGTSSWILRSFISILAMSIVGYRERTGHGDGCGCRFGEVVFVDLAGGGS